MTVAKARTGPGAQGPRRGLLRRVQAGERSGEHGRGVRDRQYVLTLLVGGGRVVTVALLLSAAIGSPDTTAAAALAALVVLPPLVLVALAARSAAGGTPGAPGFARL